jgi:hypothetical protein
VTRDTGQHEALEELVLRRGAGEITREEFLRELTKLHEEPAPAGAA